jgi:hypothetical protein
MIPAMSDRGLPIVDGAPACPFVAFDDDRDGRATAPDHRHRCFAEAVPAPRALAHQDAYCLSPAFAVCPAFQDWARREAARARPGAASTAPAEARPAREETPTPAPMPPLEREARHAPADAGGSIPARRPPARDWAAPPPWTAGDADPDAAAGAPGLAPAPAPGAVSGWNVAAAGAAGAAGAAAGGAGRPRSRDDDRADASRGLADSAAARLAGPDPDAPVAAQPQRGRTPDLDADDDRYDDVAPGLAPVAAAVPPSRPQAPPARAAAPPPRKPAATPAQATRDAEEMFGPAWERPRRYEAYPSLRTRVGLPSFAGLPRLGVAAVALVAAALVLFFVGPMLLGLGGKSPTSGVATQSPIASLEPSASAPPSLPPAPTPFVYTVVKGDTLTKIASRNGVTVKQILAANPQIKNQNSIAIGDQITIPVPAATPVTDVGGASASP